MSVVVGDAFVQTLTANTNAGTGSFVTGAFGASIKAGNSIVITVADDAGVINKISSIVDSAGNTYTQRISNAATDSISIWDCLGIKGGAGVTLTVTYVSASITNVSLVAQEFKGLLFPATADKSTSALATSTAPNSGASGITSRPNELVIGGVAYTAAGGVATLGATYRNLGNETTNAAIHSAQEHKVVGTTGAQTANFTITSAAWLCAVVTYYGSFPSYKPPSLRPHAFSPGIAR